MNKYIITSGIILGVAYVIFKLVLYLMGVEYMVSFWVLAIALILTLGFMIYFGIDYRSQLGGSITFGEAFKVLFFVFAIGGFIGLIFDLILYNLVDPELPMVLRQAIIDKTVGMMERFNSPDSEIDKVVTQLEAQDNQFLPWGLTKGYLMSLIWGAVIAAIIALIIKRKRVDVFETETTA